MRRLSLAALLTLAGLLLTLGTVTPASATAIYSYTGNNFDTITDNDSPSGTYAVSMNVTASCSLATALPENLPLTNIVASVLIFTLDDGRSILTNSNSQSLDFYVGTDAQGDIDRWFIQAIIAYPPSPASIGDQSRSIQTKNSLSQGVSDDGMINECTAVSGSTCNAVSYDWGGITSNPGSWSAVPEPSTALLLALGLAGIAAGRRWRAAS